MNSMVSVDFHWLSIYLQGDSFDGGMDVRKRIQGMQISVYCKNLLPSVGTSDWTLCGQGLPKNGAWKVINQSKEGPGWCFIQLFTFPTSKTQYHTTQNRLTDASEASEQLRGLRRPGSSPRAAQTLTWEGQSNCRSWTVVLRTRAGLTITSRTFLLPLVFLELCVAESI